jgi:hypothetical protein
VVDKPWTVLWTSGWTRSFLPTARPQPAHRFPTTGGMDHNNEFLLKRVPEPLVKYSHKIGSVVSGLIRSQDTMLKGQHVTLR